MRCNLFLVIMKINLNLFMCVQTHINGVYICNKLFLLLLHMYMLYCITVHTVCSVPILGIDVFCVLIYSVFYAYL